MFYWKKLLVYNGILMETIRLLLFFFSRDLAQMSSSVERIIPIFFFLVIKFKPYITSLIFHRCVIKYDPGAQNQS